MSKLSDMMKNFTDLQGMMDSVSEAMKGKMRSVKVEGQAAAGMVKVELCGDFTVESVYIDDSLFADGGAIIADLVKAAMDEALQKLQTAMQEKALSELPSPDSFKMKF